MKKTPGVLSPDVGTTQRCALWKHRFANRFCWHCRHETTPKQNLKMMLSFPRESPCIKWHHTELQECLIHEIGACSRKSLALDPCEPETRSPKTRDTPSHRFQRSGLYRWF
ncbi:hypothetical protein PAXRUDRAFT_209739 [Paxillus rubicundulus Ve08.2h10]|uniref:Uncharacterized protein n=1 Tax=Paxillus rubicundulus Ve08.2h10 TaxID=930991 RepID=A0A0D0DPR4_9AGAM|nr:hypothetical protein PAXRUDRAFT_209739 [Paxillus rubicundulus Ve08.2h10]